MLYRLADLSTEILYETGAFIHAMAYGAGFYKDERMPLMYEIRAEGSISDGGRWSSPTAVM
jgi:uncharacterized protein